MDIKLPKDMKPRRIIELKPHISIPQKKRVAAYARISVDEEINLHSLSAQITYYKNLILSNHNWLFTGVFYDEGISGTSTKSRLGFKELMDRCRKHEIDLILTKSISRFARNTVDLLNSVRELQTLGIEVRFERENISSLSGDGELMLTLLASFAQEEARSTSENTKWAIRKRFEQGIGNNFILYGYRWKDGSWHIEDTEAETVRCIFTEYLEGSSPQHLSKKYGIAYSTLWQMLRNEMYTGDTTFQRTFRKDPLTHKRVPNNGELPMYRIEEYLPALIGHETFDSVQIEIDRRKALGWMANQTTNFTCFTGLIKCCECGEVFIKRQNSCSNKNTGTKSIYHYWKCKTRIHYGDCEMGNLPHDVLLNLTSEVLENSDTLEEDVKEFISEIQVSDYKLTYIMKDGSHIEKTWEPKRNNRVYRQRRVI